MMLSAISSYLVGNEKFAKAYCQCWDKNIPSSCMEFNSCSCGEETESNEWSWEVTNVSTSTVVVSEDKKQVTFHPFYSSGTAAAKGDIPLLLNHHYYWEIKILTRTYGTDIMVGIGTDKMNTTGSIYEFLSLLGKDGESYGLSYTGAVHHNASSTRDCVGFCRGTIVGLRLDMWRGTLEFYINRKPQGISFYNLRRHSALYPMACSTAAKSSMRLIYSASWTASLLVDAAKILSASLREDLVTSIPPGLRNTFRSQFWLTLPSGGCLSEDNKDDIESMDMGAVQKPSNGTLSSLKRRH